jgi:AcrR family transcriptional regulator
MWSTTCPEEMTVTHRATAGFQRARSPEQRDVRRRAILDVAGRLLDESAVAEISLREIARVVGCANSNVLRYFETREGVFLELLDQEWAEWIEAIDAELPPAGTAMPVNALAAAVADSVAARPRMCKLMTAIGSLLMDSTSPAVAARFHDNAATRNLAAARVLTARVLGLQPRAASELVAMAGAHIAGWWPLSQPAAGLTDTRDPEVPDLVPRMNFRDGMARATAVMLTGLLAEAFGE